MTYDALSADGSNPYDLVLAAAPRLLRSPDLVNASAQSQDLAQTAQVLSQTSDATAIGQAAQQHAQHHSSLLGSFFNTVGSAFSDVGHVVEGGLNYMAKPLGSVQHDYRYLHDLWTKGDPVSATLATLGVVGGGVLGGFLGGFAGAALGADAAISLEGGGARTGLFGRKDQQLFANAQGEKISPGRDLANLLQVDSTDHGLGKFVSGLADTSFDFTADPLIAGGRLSALARLSPEGLTTVPAARAFPGLKAFFLEHGAGGIGITGGVEGGVDISMVDRLAAARKSITGIGQSPYERALGQLANGAMSGGRDNIEGTVISTFGRTLSRAAPVIGAAIRRLPENADFGEVKDAIHNSFLYAANSTDLLTNNFAYGILPTRSVLRAVTSPLVDKLKFASGTSLGDTAEGGVIPALGNLGARLTGGALPGKTVAEGGTTLSGALSQKVRTFSGYMAYGLDQSVDETGKRVLALSTKRFDLLDPGSLKGMYDAARYSMGEQGARDAVSQVARHLLPGVADDGTYVAPDLVAIRTAYRNLYMQTLVAAGIPEGDGIVTRVMRSLDESMGSSRGQSFGVGNRGGEGISRIPMTVTGPAGSDIASHEVEQNVALGAHQMTSMATYPDFQEIKNITRAQTLAKKIGGSVDEFLGEQYTRKIFKPLSLINMGFGLRVAAAEAIPAAFRYGVLNQLQNKIAGSAATAQWKVDQETSGLLERANAARDAGDTETFQALTKQIDDGEVGHRMAAMARLTGGMTKLAKVDDTKMEDAAWLTEAGQGHLVPDGVMAGQASHLEPTNAVDRASSRLWGVGNKVAGQHRTGNYTYFSPSSNHYADIWHGQIARWSKEESGGNIARDFVYAHDRGMDIEAAHDSAVTREANRIRGLNPDGSATDAPHYANERNKGLRYNYQDPAAFASNRVDLVRNLFTGADGTVHEDALKALAGKGDLPTVEALADRSRSTVPAGVSGAETAPMLPTSTYAEIVNRGFKAVVDPVINHISREPLMLASFQEQMPALRSAVDRGVLPMEEARQIARYRAAEGMLGQIHNVQLRSQFAVLSRNILPFYFAQEQAAKRTALLISKQPGAAEQYNLLNNALLDPNFVHIDDQGIRSLVIPTTGFFGSHIIDGAAALGLPLQGGLPLTFTGAMESLKTVLPEFKQPGTSPLVSIPLNELSKFFPEWSPAIKAVVGDQGFGQSLHNELIPNATLRSWFTAATGDEQDKSFANAMISALSAAGAHGQIPSTEDLANKPGVKQAFIDRIKNNARSIFFFKGLVSAFSPLSPTPVPEDAGFRDEFYKLQRAPGATYATALQEFLKRHGDSAISYTIAKTANPTGAYIPSTQTAQNFIQDNGQLIKNHISAAYFVPEISDGTKGDAQVIHNELINMGLREKQTPAQFLNEMYIKSGNSDYFAAKKIHDDTLASLTDPAAIAQEKTTFSNYTQGLKTTNAIWGDNFDSKEKDIRAQQIYKDMGVLFANGTAPPGAQTDLIKGLFQDFQQHVGSLASAPYGTKQNEKDMWAGYLKQQVTDHPELTNVVNSVFKLLDRRI